VILFKPVNNTQLATKYMAARILQGGPGESISPRCMGQNAWVRMQIQATYLQQLVYDKKRKFFHTEEVEVPEDCGTTQAIVLHLLDTCRRSLQAPSESMVVGLHVLHCVSRKPEHVVLIRPHMDLFLQSLEQRNYEARIFHQTYLRSCDAPNDQFRFCDVIRITHKETPPLQLNDQEPDTLITHKETSSPVIWLIRVWRLHAELCQSEYGQEPWKEQMVILRSSEDWFPILDDDSSITTTLEEMKTYLKKQLKSDLLHDLSEQQKSVSWFSEPNGEGRRTTVLQIQARK